MFCACFSGRKKEPEGKEFRKTAQADEFAFELVLVGAYTFQVIRIDFHCHVFHDQIKR